MKGNVSPCAWYVNIVHKQILAMEIGNLYNVISQCFAYHNNIEIGPKNADYGTVLCVFFVFSPVLYYRPTYCLFLTNLCIAIFPSFVWGSYGFIKQ